MAEEQYHYLKDALPGFGQFGITDRALGHDPLNCIFYRKKALQLIAASGYWISKTPHIPQSKSWGSGYPRTANWIRFTEKCTCIEFRLINTHLDNVSRRARLGQMRVILRDALSYPANYPQVLTGDFNSDSQTRVVRAVKASGFRDTYEEASQESIPSNTYHGFLGPEWVATRGRIDFIFVRGEAAVIGAAVVRDAIDGRYPSDHYFVTAEIELTRAHAVDKS